MNGEMLWKLFEQTGNTGIYLLYKQEKGRNIHPIVKAGETHCESENPRNCDQRAENQPRG